MILLIQQGLAVDVLAALLAKLCRWFRAPRRTVYYKPVKSAPKIDPKLAEPIKAMIEESPSFGYRTVAHTFWALTITRCSASSSSRAGRSRSVRSDPEPYPGIVLGSNCAQ